MSFKLFLDSNSIAAATQAKRGLLTVPTDEQNPTLYKKSEDDQKWRELFEVKDTKMALKEGDESLCIVTIQYRVSDECPYDPNKNKIFTKSYWLTIPAIKDSTHADHKKTMMNIGKLNSMIRGCGVPLEKDDNGLVPYHMYFNGDPETGAERPLIGLKFWGVVRDYSYKSRKNDEIVFDQDIDNFIPVTS